MTKENVRSDCGCRVCKVLCKTYSAFASYEFLGTDLH